MQHKCEFSDHYQASLDQAAKEMFTSEEDQKLKSQLKRYKNTNKTG
jgi:hypothetical protein